MKKFLFGIICVLAFGIIAYNISNNSDMPEISAKNGAEYRESYNNEINMKLARNIAAMTRAKQVAVIGNKKGVLVGISLKSGTGGRNALRENAEKTVREAYPDTEIYIEIETEKAEKILNLAANMERGIPEKILSARISYLLEN